MNDKNARKLITRIINANFTEKDLWVTLTYDNEHLPDTEEGAYRDVTNYLRRLKYRRERLGLPGLRYVYVLEGRAEKDAAGKPILRYHAHLVISGDGMNRDEIEQMWHGGARREAHRLQPDEFELTGLARYITKGMKEGRKRWGRSQNLKVPKPTIADHKITKRQVEKLAQNENTALEKFEKIYKGYRFLDMEIKRSDFAPGAYIYVRLRKKASKPAVKVQEKRRCSEATVSIVT